MYLTKHQIESFVQLIGQPEASILLNRFFNSYRSHLHSNDVKELYDDEYRNILLSTPIYRTVDDKYKIHIYNKYSYEYLLSKPRGSAVLDIGCGDGDFALALAHNGYKCVGVDFSETLIKAAKSKASLNTLDTEFICTDIGSIPDSAGFNYIVMNDVIEHLSDRELSIILSKVVTLLRPAGEIIIHTPNGLALCNDTGHSFLQYLYKYYLRISQGFKGFERTASQIYYDQVHINIKTYKQLKRLLLQHSFMSKVFYDEYQQPALKSVQSSNMLVVARRISP